MLLPATHGHNTLLHCAKLPCNDAGMHNATANVVADVLTSARMAAGMTSRARRPAISPSAG